jgi:hypothetical protein
MKSTAELHLSEAPAVDDEPFATAVPDCCSEMFITLVLLHFKHCAHSRFIRRIHKFFCSLRHKRPQIESYCFISC